jgi:hypothetical protein
MTTASQDTGATAIRVETDSLAGHSTIFKLLCAAVFALMLALAPAPAFAQHGGGGGGGGGAHGGSGGGGGHVGGGSGGGGSHAGATSAPSGGGSHGGGASASSSNNGGGHWWNPFHSGASASGSGASGSRNSGTNANTEHFAAGNNTWQEPPAPVGHSSAAVNHYAPASGTRPVVVGQQPTNRTIGSIHGAGAVAGPPHVFPPRRGGYPGYFYYPYPYFGFGFGGGLWGGGFYPCDPFWGCYGYGYDGGYGFYGGSFGGDYSADLSYNSPDDAGSLQEPNPSLFAAPAWDAGQSYGETSQQPYVILYLKDGSSYAVSDYWLAGGKLHYVTSYGGENVIDESQLDLQRTVNENATRGVDFTLRPEPAGNGEATPAMPAAPNAPPAAPPQ